MHDNLALILVDYVTQKRFLTFIGISEVSRTATELLSIAQTLKVDPILKLVPKDTIDADLSLSELYDVKKDMDSADYILDIDLLSSMSGKYYANKRHELNRFLKTYTDYKIMITTVDKHRELVETVFDQWTMTRVDHDWRHERTALLKVLNQREIPYLLYAFEVNGNGIENLAFENVENKVSSEWKKKVATRHALTKKTTKARRKAKPKRSGPATKSCRGIRKRLLLGEALPLLSALTLGELSLKQMQCHRMPVHLR
jgi:hypothetical protein